MVISRLLTVTSGGLVLLIGAACTSSPAPAPAPRTPSAASVSASRTSQAPHEASLSGRSRSAGGAAGTVTLAFAGDVHFEGRTRLLLADPATAFGPISTVLR